MKHITFLLALLMAFAASAQQVNPVPDYVFRNQMSVGRNAVTDTSAYISIGPRYGATKGLMPPVVNDTNAVTGTKRNGLMIFSIQKKNYLFWDSTYGRWSSISGTVDTTLMATRAWRQKGDDSLGRIINQNLIGGGPSVSYYLNHGVVTSVAGYKQMSKVAVINVGADTSKTGNGLVAQFLTDAGDPSRLEIPGGAWNFEMWFSISSIGGSVKFYVELLKYNGSTFTSIASSSVVPEEITGGTDPDLYLTSLAVPQTSLLITDRLALRVYIVDNAPGRTVTLHTQNGHLCQIVTTFSAGITALNGLTQSVQNFAVGTTGTDFNISSVTDLHTFNLPTASATNRGALSSANWTTFNNKIDGTGTTNYVSKFTGAGTIGNSQIFDNGTNVGVGTASPAYKMDVSGGLRGLQLYTGSFAEAGGFMQFNYASGNASSRSWRASNDVVAYGDFAIGQSTTQTGSTFDNTRFYISNLGNVGIGGTPLDKFTIFQDQNATSTARVRNTDVGSSAYAQFVVNASGNSWGFRMGSSAANSNALDIVSDAVGTPASRLRIFANGRVGINTTTDAGYQLDINGTLRSVNGANFATTSGVVGIGTASPFYKLDVNGAVGLTTYLIAQNSQTFLGDNGVIGGGASDGNTTLSWFNGKDLFFKESASTRVTFKSGGEVLINTATDAGDYKLQVVGNALVSTGKLDITSNTAFGFGLSRSGTSSIAGQVFNSTGVLYFGAESSTGGSIFTGSTLYAGVIGTGANKPLQFATNNIVRMEIDSVGLVGINTTTPTQQLDVNGRARIRTVDSTATAINTLYVDVDGIVKKAQASSQMADDVISPIGSYVAAKDAGSGTVINNVSYVTNGTVKMVTVDAALYITSAGFTESVWNNIGTVPAAYRPKKTVNWNNNYIISGAEYERDDNTDFTGAMDWVITQMRIKDDGSIEVNGDINTNSIAVGGTGYVLIPFTISYIVK